MTLPSQPPCRPGQPRRPGAGPLLHERTLLVTARKPARPRLATLLAQRGCRVFPVNDAMRALEQAVRLQPSLILLDLELSGLGQRTVLTRLRQSGIAAPILILSRCTDVSERVKQLQLGADDYLEKPFELEELLARMRALLRRGGECPALKPRLRLGTLVIDLECMTAADHDHEFPLSRTDCVILDLLVRQKGRPVTRPQLLDAVRCTPGPPSHRSSLDRHLRRLRRKLGDVDATQRWIRTVPGVGYQLRHEGTEREPRTG